MSEPTISVGVVGEWEAAIGTTRDWLVQQQLVKCPCGAWVRPSVLGRHGTQVRAGAVVDCQGNEVKL